MLTFLVSRGVPTETYSTNGVFEFDQAKALAAAGCKVVLLALDLRSVLKTRHWGFESFSRDGVQVLVLNVPLGNLPKKIFYGIGEWALNRLYQRAVKEFGKPDVVHAHFTDCAYLAALLQQKEHFPLAVTEHSSLINQEKIPKNIEKAAKYAYAKADMLIAVSPSLAIRMQQHSHRTVKWIPDLVDTGLFTYSDEHEKQRALLEETEMESAAYSILSCGNLRPVKRMDVLIQAFAKAFKDCPNVTLTICGQGPEEGKLHQMIYDLQMTDRIQLAGLRPREEIASRLQNSDCFALASISETFGVSYLEALSCGVPVVATRCGGPECFVNENNGIMVEPDNVEELSKALLTMYCNNGHYNRAAIAQDIRNHYSAQAVANSLMEEYQKLIDQKVPAASVS